MRGEILRTRQGCVFTRRLFTANRSEDNSIAKLNILTRGTRQS